MPKRNLWLIDEFSGGYSDQDNKGILGAFAYGQSIDFRTTPGSFTGGNIPIKNTTTIIEALPKWICKLGASVYAYDADGKIYKSGTPWTKVRTNGQTGVGNGMGIMGTNLYYAANAKLGKDDGTFGAPNDSFQTFTSGTAGDWHPMKLFGGAGGLCIGDGRYIATLDADGSTWAATDLTLPLNKKIKCLEVWNDFLVIGTYEGTNAYDNNSADLFLWDGISSTYNSVINLNDSGIHALLTTPYGLLICAGVRGNVYFYNGGVPTLIKRIPDQGLTRSSYNEIYPGAVTNFGGLAMIGTAGGGADASALKGVFSWGTVNKNYPMTLGYDYVLSTGHTTGATVYTSAVAAVNDTNMYIGWRDDTSYGIDLVNSSNKATSAVYRSLWFDAGLPYSQKDFKTFVVQMTALAANETITLAYRKDSQSSFTTIGAISSAGEDFIEFNHAITCRRIQLQVTLAGTTTSPTIEALSAIFDIRDMD